MPQDDPVPQDGWQKRFIKWANDEERPLNAAVTMFAGFVLFFGVAVPLMLVLVTHLFAFIIQFVRLP